MLKNKKTVIFGILALFTALTLTISLSSAGFADKSFQKLLKDNGFSISSMPEPEKRIGALRYKNIVLGDTNRETTIDTLTITYHPLFWSQIKSLSINGIYISGELDINAKLSLKGIPESISTSKLSNTPIETISIKDINFSILSAHFGGLRGTAHITGQKESDAIIWVGNIDSRQDQLEIIAKLNAQTNKSGTWIADLEIENAKLERNFGKFTRLNGVIQTTGQNEHWERLSAELTAGGFISHGTSWQNASLSIQANPSQNKAYIAAKSTGVEGLELNVEAILGLRDIKWAANIHAETGHQLTSYLKAHNISPFNNDDLKKIEQVKDINMRLAPSKNSLMFNIKKENQNIDIKGNI